MGFWLARAFQPGAVALFHCVRLFLFESNLVNSARNFQGLRDLTLKNIVQPEEVSGVVEHLFRHEAGKMVATLTKIFGIEHLTLAEDVVQETLARALQTWPFYGVPKNPSAWIMRASRNLALDVVRRRKVFQNKQAEIIRLMDRETAGTAVSASSASAGSSKTAAKP